MENTVKIPQGENKIKVELTLKEAIALTGVHFKHDPELVHRARKKLKQTITEVTNEEAVH
ncbi:hypothetical protein [Longirhabdus pacifica]|uniref:hypothetical protein n=1 Tax=Longirhabdus pacifica TaxID=2305227 RepID=UPI001008DC8B|nr:hypothetical protein [Longirhabdus pacifica]